jgi:heme/copper-type cytochrome/quinol oxidase subunit 3
MLRNLFAMVGVAFVMMKAAEWYECFAELEEENEALKRKLKAGAVRA